MAQGVTPASTSTSSLDDKQTGPPEQNTSLTYDSGESPGILSSSFNREHVFDDPRLGKYFVPIPEYEGMHR